MTNRIVLGEVTPSRGQDRPPPLLRDSLSAPTVRSYQSGTDVTFVFTSFTCTCNDASTAVDTAHIGKLSTDAL